ncbi:lytic polysaccharide monooxygenase [Kitasatospora sp. NPDC088391]|uniref:lytic polysaccharide monooxygenase auxiliary activity family 9 protein n=1 Tax=Kitasatospora sp. NPDC088391 TaxID=3364074 RepID=UPI00382F4AC7
MRPYRRLLVPALLTTVLTVAAGAGTAQAHGSMQKPLSRLEGCYLEGAESPKSAACRAAVAAGGTAALYDWMSLRIGDAAGRHRQLIPDGHLCSAGNDMDKGLDLPRADWPATNLRSGAAYTFEFRATAPHKGTFQLFLTNASYSPTKPLTWANLDPQPFLTATDPQLSNGSYLLPGTIPSGRTGRQLLYVIWQRSDSPEAFYSCSDVVFDGTGTAAAPPTPPAAPTTGHTHSPTPSPSPSPSRVSSPSATAPTTPPPPTSLALPAPTAPPIPLDSPRQLAATGSNRSPGLIMAICAVFLLAGVTVLLHRRLRPGRGTHR